jgi:hypothetical protein
MRPSPAYRLAPFLGPLLAALALSAQAIAPPPARAQARSMECNPVSGGRLTCTTSGDALVDDLGAQAADRDPAAAHRRAAARKQVRLARAVERAVREGRCDDAQRFAVELGHPELAQAAARECAPRAAPAGPSAG